MSQQTLHRRGIGRILIGTVASLLAVVLSATLATALPPHSKGDRTKAKSVNVAVEQVADDGVYQSRRTQGGGLYDAASDTTYVVWNAGAMDIHIRGYHHGTRSWGEPILIAKWGNTGTWAYHDYAVLNQMPDGRLVIFASHHTADLVQFVAPLPHSAGGTWAKETISTDRVAYPEPVVIGGTVYLFYNRNDDQSWPYRTYKVIRSTDNGTTWSSPRNIVDTGKTVERFDEVYVKSADEVNGRACLTWTLAGGSAHNAASRDLYGACLDPLTDRMETLSGASLGMTVDTGDLSASLLLAAPTSSTVKHPIQLAALTRNKQTGETMVGVGVTLNGVGQVQVGTVKTAAEIEWTTVSTGSSSFRDMVWSGAGVEVLSMPNRSTIQADVVSGQDVTTLWSYPVPYGDTGADASYTATYIENRSTISAVMSTINVATRTSDYSGSWPILAVFAD